MSNLGTQVSNLTISLIDLTENVDLSWKKHGTNQTKV
jgi:hypothetical protein